MLGGDLEIVSPRPLFGETLLPRATLALAAAVSNREDRRDPMLGGDLEIVSPRPLFGETLLPRATPALAAAVV
jgi:hypothetical protein